MNNSLFINQMKILIMPDNYLYKELWEVLKQTGFNSLVTVAGGYAGASLYIYTSPSDVREKFAEVAIKFFEENIISSNIANDLRITISKALSYNESNAFNTNYINAENR